jgi:hypothetical protein
MTLFGADGKPLKRAKPKRAVPENATLIEKTGRTTPEGDPFVEMTPADMSGARKFLMFLLEDLYHQAGKIGQNNAISIYEREQTKTAALLLHKYLSAQIQEIDRVIAIGKDAELAACEAASDSIN